MWELVLRLIEKYCYNIDSTNHYYFFIFCMIVFVLSFLCCLKFSELITEFIFSSPYFPYATVCVVFFCYLQESPLGERIKKWFSSFPRKDILMLMAPFEIRILDYFDYQNPLVWLVLILVLGFSYTVFTKSSHINLAALIISFVALLLGVFVCLLFDKSAAAFQFVFHLPGYGVYNIRLVFGVDGISLLFLMLTLFTFPLCFLSAWGVQKKKKQFFNYLLSMEVLLVLTFTTLDILYFYVFFESLLIPMFIMIGVWGARERKIKAAYFFFLYTLFGSLFMLFGILYLYFLIGSTNYFIILHVFIDLEQQKLLWLCFFMAFAVKIPLFPFHIWLPEAHVEAPTVGSMLLASLLLKLGGYGFLRFSLTLLNEASLYYAPVVSLLALLGVVYGSFSTIRQIDLKRIIAYSSVAHMNLVVLGLFSFCSQGIEGAIFLMIAHGVVSAALFFCVGVLYDRYHSRLLRYYGGLVSVMPLFSSFFFFFTLANMSFPGTSNFLGELLIFTGLFYKNSTAMVLSTISIVLSAVYSTWLYNRVVFGVLKTAYISRFTDVSLREFVILLSFLIPMIFLGLNTNFILDFVRMPVELILL